MITISSLWVKAHPSLKMIIVWPSELRHGNHQSPENPAKARHISPAITLMGAVTTVQAAWPGPAIPFLSSSSSLMWTEFQVILSFLKRLVLPLNYSKANVCMTNYAYLPRSKITFWKTWGKIIFCLFKHAVLLLHLVNIAKRQRTIQPEAPDPGFLLWVPGFPLHKGWLFAL